MRVRIIDASKDKRWDEFVLNHKLGSIYHHSAWKEVIEKSFTHTTPLYFILEDETGKLKAAIPFFLVKSWLTGVRLVSSPFSSYCDPLVDTLQDFNRLMKIILQKKKELNASYIEIRTKKNEENPDFDKLKKHSQYITHILSLEKGAEFLRRSFHRTCVRQKINRAEKSNLTVREGESEKDMKTFYKLHLLTRKKHGLPPPPYKFLQNMWRIMRPKDLITLLLVEYENKTIAGLVLLKFKDTIYCEYNGVDDRFLRYCPNHCLLWKAIKMACNKQYRYFDFGRSSSNNRGLIDFKRRWGAKEYGLDYFYYPEIKGISSIQEENIKYRVVTKMERRMPLLLTKISGKIIYRHLGG